MSLATRLAALESSMQFKRDGRTYDMSMLSTEQLELIERAASGGAEINGTNYLNVDGFSDHEMAELQKGLWLAGVLRKGERFK